jgi:hypothetical protein
MPAVYNMKNAGVLAGSGRHMVRRLVLLPQPQTQSLFFLQLEAGMAHECKELFRHKILNYLN